MNVLVRALVVAAAFAEAPPARAQNGFSLDIDGPQAVALGVAATVLTVLVVASRSVRFGEAVRNAALLGGLFVALVAGYAYRTQIEDVGREVMSAFVPGMVVSSGDEVVVRRGFGGHFVLNGEVGGTRVQFLFDTGASTVVLTAEDAARAGYDLEALDFRIPVMTAAGMTEVAPVQISELGVGDIRMENVRAAVARAGDLDHSLLGLTFLNRLEGYNVRRDRLVLIP